MQISFTGFIIARRRNRIDIESFYIIRSDTCLILEMGLELELGEDGRLVTVPSRRTIFLSSFVTSRRKENFLRLFVEILSGIE